MIGGTRSTILYKACSILQNHGRAGDIRDVPE